MDNSGFKSNEGSPKRRILDHLVRMKMPNGAQYQGQVYNDKPQGRGKMKYLNGQRYEGDFFNGMKHGKGKYYYMKGELYIGDWFQNKKQGKGQYFYKNGTIYNGDFVDNKKHGIGKIEEPNGSYYDGQFNENNKDRSGIYYDASKKIKYLLTYQNGRVVKQEVKEDLNQVQVKASSEYKQTPVDNKSKEKPQIPKEIVSQKVFSCQRQSGASKPAYVSHFHSGSLQLINSSNKSLTAQNSGKRPFAPQNYLDATLLAIKVVKWTNVQVSSWLNQIGFGDCIQEFRDNHIQGDSLLVLQNDDLKQLGVSALGDRRILKRQIQFLKLIFKSQCINQPIAKYANHNLTIELVKKIMQETQNKKKEEAKLGQGHMSSSSSSASSDRSKNKEKSRMKLSMQCKLHKLRSQGVQLPRKERHQPDLSDPQRTN